MSVISSLINKLPYIRLLVSRIHNLEQSAASLQETIAELFDILNQQSRRQSSPSDAGVRNSERAFLPLPQKVDTIEQQTNEIRNDIDYFYFRGLHPHQYREALCEWYQFHKGEPLDLDHPRTLHQKIQWLKLYEPRQMKTLLADKYLMRGWIEERIGPGHTVPLLGVWDRFDEIDFDLLPGQFVLKANNGSARNIIVTDKSKLEVQQVRAQFSAWMSHNFAFMNGLELQYKDIPPKIIAEEYIAFESGICREYRIYCLHGVPHVVWVADISSRHTTKLHSIYKLDWTPHPYGIINPQTLATIPRPCHFDEMVEMAKVLSKDLIFVRMDFFEANGRAYLGEFTFTPASGAARNMSNELSCELGDLIHLPGFPCA